MYYHGMMGGGMWMGMLVYLLFWLLVFGGFLALILFLLKKGTGGFTGKSEETALEILKKRYARGEIGKEEYEEKKRAIV